MKELITTDLAIGAFGMFIFTLVFLAFWAVIMRIIDSKIEEHEEELHKPTKSRRRKK